MDMYSNIAPSTRGLVPKDIKACVNLSDKTRQPLSVSGNKASSIEPNAETDFSTMADYQQAKQARTAARRAAATKNDIAGRRHNEPLNQHALDVMTRWYQTNTANPYPNKAVKEQLARDGGISVQQVKSWFANKRNRSNNTRPKKQKQEMESRLMEICHQLARDASKPHKDNAYYIQQLSSILH